MPSIADIIRARLRTVGVEEHQFMVEKGADSGSDVFITDVGGCRSQVSHPMRLKLRGLPESLIASFLGAVFR